MDAVRLLRRHPGVLWRASLDGVVVLPTAGEAPLHISSPGDALWALLEEPKTLGELAGQLAEIPGVDREQVVRDIGILIEELLASGAVLSGE